MRPNAELLDVADELPPAGEAVLAGDDELRVGEDRAFWIDARRQPGARSAEAGDRGVSASAGGAEKILRALAELLQRRTRWKPRGRV
jgi:hypothetical protein